MKQKLHTLAEADKLLKHLQEEERAKEAERVRALERIVRYYTFRSESIYDYAHR